MAYTKPGVTRNRIYQFMRKRLLEGRPPTIREVQRAFKMRAVQSAKSHLDALVREGLLTKQPGKARGYQLPASHQIGRLAPVVGKVPAGPFNLAIEDIEGYIPVQSYSAEQTLFALRVSGDSMVDAGIFDGDIVLVRHQSEIHQGDIVVAMIEDETTVKEFRRVDAQVELHPHNQRYDILKPEPKNLQILGKVIEVRRYLENISFIEAAING